MVGVREQVIVPTRGIGPIRVDAMTWISYVYVQGTTLLRAQC